jgi:hypothetical protein
MIISFAALSYEYNDAILLEREMWPMPIGSEWRE